MERNGFEWFEMDRLTDSRHASRVFRGIYEHQIKQGRIILPARFREVLQERECNLVVMVRFPNRLDVYPENEWLVREEQLQLLDQDDDRVFQYVHYLQANQLEADVDKQGRILVPPRWRTALELENTAGVVLMGAKTHFEIWPAAGYEEAYRRWDADYSASRAYVGELRKSLRQGD